MVTGRESDEAVGAVAQHATVPSQSETERRWVRLFSMQPYPVRVRRETRRWGTVVQHATVPSESELRDEAMGAVAQRATVPRECESEIEQRLWASAEVLGDPSHYQSQFLGL